MSERCSHCGQIISKRSVPQHRRYYAVVRAAFAHWPMAHVETGEMIDFQPDDAEHLRKYLQVKSGPAYRTVTTVPVPSEEPAIVKLALLAAEAAVQASGGYAFMRPHGQAIAVFSAKSIKFDSMSHKAFVTLCELVENEIEHITGLKVADLLKTDEAAEDAA